MNLITYPEREKVYAAALEKWGEGMQGLVAIEELSELQKEICKRFRGKDNDFQLADEIADATIMLEQLRIMFGLNELVCKRMDIKIMRLSDRVDSKGKPLALYEQLWTSLRKEKEEDGDRRG